MTTTKKANSSLRVVVRESICEISSLETMRCSVLNSSAASRCCSNSYSRSGSGRRRSSRSDVVRFHHQRVAASSSESSSSSSSSSSSVDVDGAAQTRTTTETIKEEESKGLTGETLQKLKQDLTEDLSHLFDDVGIDPKLYAENVVFTDPLSKYESFTGYNFNIQMLKNVFKPIYTMHSIEKTNDFEITTRWTMKMYLPSFPFLWNPELTFTGRSIMEMDQRFPHECVKHVDTWDSIENQTYLSPEAVQEVLKQVFNFTKTPENLKTPKYVTLRRYRDFEVREYEKFFVAETTVNSNTGSAKMEDSEAGQAFNRLAGYIFGKNEQNEKMEMTTPVFSNKNQKMQFVVEESSNSIKPVDGSVAVKDRERFLVAVASFSGIANKEITDETEKKLREAMKREESIHKDGVEFLPRRGDEFVELAQYNDPFTNPLQRRNEVLIALENIRDDFIALV